MKKHMHQTGQRLWIIFVVFALLFFCQWEPIKPVSKVVKSIAEDITGIIEADGVTKKIALTFDDGPHPIYTPELLEGLKERDVVVTFFVTGENASLYPALIEQMQEDGHRIGNHTYHHVQLSAVGEEIFLQEIKETNRVLEGILGEEIVFVRPPYGDWTKSVEQEVEMFPVLWDIDPLDWCTGNSEQIVRNITKELEENDIILMHDYYAPSVEAALQLVDKLLGEGFEFVTVDDILFQ